MEIWHNPRCSKSRAALALLEESQAEVTIRRYLDDPPTADELRAVLDALGLEPWDVTRLKEDAARDLGMAGWPRDDRARWIDALVAHPQLIERPIVIAGDRAVLGRPPEAVRDLL